MRNEIRRNCLSIVITGRRLDTITIESFNRDFLIDFLKDSKPYPIIPIIRNYITYDTFEQTNFLSKVETFRFAKRISRNSPFSFYERIDELEHIDASRIYVNFFSSFVVTKKVFFVQEKKKRAAKNMDSWAARRKYRVRYLKVT